MTCKYEKLEERVKDLEAWIDDFEAAAEIVEKELQAQFGDVEVTFVPDSSMLRDKSKDN
jgi:hypothetical protein